ncbi:TPA: hypothetical protein DEB72_00300 [Patescibacteria group bacterium]|nr:hypothetical protein [Patescibacteria group bacterium]
MTQKVLRVGTSAAVTIPKSTLAEMGLKVGDLVQVEFDQAKQLVAIKPSRPSTTTDDRVAKLTLNLIKRYHADLKALAKA